MNVDCIAITTLKTFKFKTWQHTSRLFETSTQKRKLEIIFRGKLKTADITVEQSRYSTYTDVEDDL